jgi:hypothetical protein
MNNGKPLAVGLLDLHDSNLQLWHGGTHVQSPGYALLKDGNYLFGATARAAARLRPREVNTRYWWRLSTEALQPSLGPARHTGDLVHAHLLELHEQAGKPAEVLLAVPGSMQRDQLALLLGIVQQCPFDAVGLVNRSVALGSLFTPRERIFHLEIQLHQALVSELSPRGSTLELHRTTPLPGCGLLKLQERLAEIVATEFVRQTRFDPRHKAATEQQLYDALPGALLALRERADTNLDVNGYQARIGAQQLEAAGQGLFDTARDAIGALRDGDRVSADPLAALLPGLADTLQGLELLEWDDIHQALRLHEEQLTQRSEALSFVVALPFLGAKGAFPREAGTAARDPVGAAQSVTATQPTHLLDGHVARPLIASGTELGNGWVLYREAAGWQLRGGGATALVNGSAWRPGQILAAGDTIAINGGDVARLIEVVP